MSGIYFTPLLISQMNWGVSAPAPIATQASSGAPSASSAPLPSSLHALEEALTPGKFLAIEDSSGNNQAWLNQAKQVYEYLAKSRKEDKDLSLPNEEIKKLIKLAESFNLGLRSRESSDSTQKLIERQQVYQLWLKILSLQVFQKQQGFLMWGFFRLQELIKKAPNRADWKQEDLALLDALLKYEAKQPLTKIHQHLNRNSFIGRTGRLLWKALKAAKYISPQGRILEYSKNFATFLTKQVAQRYRKQLFNLLRQKEQERIMAEFEQKKQVFFAHFVLNIMPTLKKVQFYIKSPSQANQIVSEGMGYWMRSLTYAARILPANDRVRQVYYQQLFDGLLRGVLNMRNTKGLTAWRCFLSETTGRLRFDSLPDRYSATDADLYIAWAILKAAELAKLNGTGIWEKREFVDPKDEKKKCFYQELLKDHLSRIKEYNVRVLEIVRDGKKYSLHCLLVSDSWGREDMKGNCTVNLSYGVLSALRDFALFEKEDENRVFWAKLLHDHVFLTQKAVKFTEARYDALRKAVFTNQMIVAGNTDDDKVIRLTSNQVLLLRYLLWKIKSPAELKDKEFQLDPNLGLVVLNQERLELNTGINSPNQPNKDGSWNISFKTAQFILNEAQKRGWQKFFPDQIEVGVTTQGHLIIRPEVDAGNLSYMEDADAVRVYREWGHYLSQASKENQLPAAYRVASQVRTLLLSFLTNRNTPSAVRAGRYHNLVALSCYLTAHTGLSSDSLTVFSNYFNTYVTDKNRGWFDSIRGTLPQYYNASLAILTALSLAASAKESNILRFGPIAQIITGETPPLIPADMKFGGKILGGIGLGLDYVTMQNPLWNAELYYFANMLQSTLFFPFAIAGKDSAYYQPVYAIFAKRMQIHMERNKNKTDISLRLIYIYTLIGTGEYRKARGELVNLLRDFPEPSNIDAEHKLKEIIKSLNAILMVLNYSDIRVADLYKWLMENSIKLNQKHKVLFLRLAYIRYLNRTGQSSLALNNLQKWHADFKALYPQAKCAFVGINPFTWLCRRQRQKEFEAWIAQRTMYAGISGVEPMTRYYLYSTAIEELIWAFADIYKLEKAGGDNYRARCFALQETLSLAYLFLGSSFKKELEDLMSQGNFPRKFKQEILTDLLQVNPRLLGQFTDILNYTKNAFSSVMAPRLMLTVARIFFKQAYELHNVFGAERSQGGDATWFSSKAAQNYRRKILLFCSLAEKLIHKALKAEQSAFKRRDTDTLLELYQLLISVKFYRSGILRDFLKVRVGEVKEKIEQQKPLIIEQSAFESFGKKKQDVWDVLIARGYINKNGVLQRKTPNHADLPAGFNKVEIFSILENKARGLTDGEATREALAQLEPDLKRIEKNERSVVRLIENLSASFLWRNVLLNRLKLWLPLDLLYKDSLLRARARISGSHDSADPREALRALVLLQSANLLMGLGIETNNQEAFIHALRLSTAVSSVRTSNRMQTAEFIYQSIINTSDILYQLAQQLKDDNIALSELKNGGYFSSIHLRAEARFLLAYLFSRMKVTNLIPRMEDLVVGAMRSKLLEGISRKKWSEQELEYAYGWLELQIKKALDPSYKMTEKEKKYADLPNAAWFRATVRQVCETAKNRIASVISQHKDEYRARAEKIITAMQKYGQNFRAMQSSAIKIFVEETKKRLRFNLIYQQIEEHFKQKTDQQKEELIGKLLNKIDNLDEYNHVNKMAEFGLDVQDFGAFQRLVSGLKQGILKLKKESYLQLDLIAKQENVGEVIKLLSPNGRELFNKIQAYLPELLLLVGGKNVFAVRLWVAYGNLSWWGTRGDQLGREQAINAYEIALSADPGEINALLSLADIYLAKEGTREGTFYKDKALTLIVRAVRSMLIRGLRPELLLRLRNKFIALIAEEFSAKNQSKIAFVKNLLKTKGTLTIADIEMIAEQFKDD